MQKISDNFYVAGISHKSDQAHLVGDCAMSGNDCDKLEAEILNSRPDEISEITILSTCNRFEVYVAGKSEKSLQIFYSALGDFGKPSDELKKYAYLKSNLDALTHLFEVASGLHSQMIGETEILGQVKAAYARASQTGHCKTLLNTAFQKCAQCAKWIRTNTDIGHGKITLGSVCAELASRIFEDVNGAKILLLGSGEAGKLVADALYVRGSSDITVASRTRANADTLAEAVGVKSADLQESLGKLAQYDIIICASRAPYNLITLPSAKAAAEVRYGKPIFLIDLAVPSNIEPSCADLDNVFLYNLADLSKIANENIEARKAEIAAAKDDIAQKAQNIASRLW